MFVFSAGSDTFSAGSDTFSADLSDNNFAESAITFPLNIHTICIRLQLVIF